MGSIPELSVIKGAQRAYDSDLLHRIFQKNANGDHGNTPAIIFNGASKTEKKISYRDLNSLANRIASMLIERVAKQNARPNLDGDFCVAVCMSPSDELIATLLAILKTGAAYLPLDPSFPPNRINHILQEARPVCVIYDDATVSRNLFGEVDALSFASCEADSKGFDDVDISEKRMLGAGHLAIILYTSGSTGVPKGKSDSIIFYHDSLPLLALQEFVSHIQLY